MAERRMFSKAIVSSSKFLKMPASSRLLYYDLGMAADDDGIAEAYVVMKMTGATEDDLRVLYSRGFIKILNEDFVTIILDWNENNKIRQDRHKPSIYAYLLKDLDTIPLPEFHNSQIAAGCQPNDNQMTTNCHPNDGVGKDRIGKVSIGEDNKANVEDIENINNISYAQSNGKNAIILADGSVFIVPEKEISILKSAYPKIDVEAEIKKMAAWAMANPAKRKTRRGIMRFVNSWLSSANDKQPKESKERVWNEL